MVNVKSGTTPYWVFYLSEYHKQIDYCGKWIHLFEKKNYQFAKEVCICAIKDNVVTACKHTSFEIDSLINPLSRGKDTGVICFYVNGTSDESHKLLLEFMIKNELVQKTKSGKLYNIGFKFDEQTLNNEYGEDFTPKIKLEDFVDLQTYQFIR